MVAAFEEIIVLFAAGVPITSFDFFTSSSMEAIKLKITASKYREDLSSYHKLWKFNKYLFINVKK